MGDQIRSRGRTKRLTGEDVMAIEPEMDFHEAGPHFPMLFSRKLSEEDDEEPLIEVVF